MGVKTNKRTIEKNRINKPGESKYFEPILGQAFNYALGLSELPKQNKQGKEIYYSSIVIGRV